MTTNADGLRDERRTEVAEADEGTVLLALGIEQWAWARAERSARERATLCRLLRSTTLFANVSREAHVALATALQKTAIHFKEVRTESSSIYSRCNFIIFYRYHLC